MFDAVIVGSGAAGLMCASTLVMNNKNINVLLLEKNDKVGKKLSITGNGRCNLGNKNKDISNYDSESDLSGFKEILEKGKYLDYLKEIGIYVKEENNFLYPNSNQAIGVVKAFERYILNNGCNIKYNYEVKSINKENDYFIINNDIKCKYLVIATGGISYPKTGSTGDGYDLLNDYHTITNLYPSLTPLISDYKYLKDISGVRFDSNVKLLVDNKLIDSEIGQVQFTDYGASGICIFNLSRNVKKYLDLNHKITISIDLVYNLKDINLLINKFDNYKIEDALSNIINNKLANALCKELGIYGKRVSDVDINRVIDKLYNFNLNITGVKPYEYAQVTKGGLRLDEFNQKLESKKYNDLYVIGEILDVDGKCGGYNLSWAFTSAIISAIDILNKNK